MAKLSITFAVDRYDYLRPLIDRVIEPEGIELRIIEVPAGMRHERMYRHEEYDVCEFALGGHIVAASRGLLRGRAIPAFPRRMFPHKFLAVRADGGIDSPKDLVGKKVGIVSYENSLQIPVRSALQHQYGLPKDAIRWMVVDRGLLGIDAVEGVRMEVIGPRPGLEERLVAGELDAIVIPFIIEPLIRRDPRVRGLFRDPKSEEKRYYEATGHFPIMHDVLLKQSVLDKNPWVAHSLLDALRKSRQIHLAWMEQPPNTSFAWGRELLLEERAFFGPKQWEDGFEANRGQLDLMCRYAREQGITAELVDPASMFVPSTLDS
jgi:4,5-dihydroxyphthalate decarboxylase